MHQLTKLLFTLTLFGYCFGVGAVVLEEILVTAQKREQDIQDVNISVSAFSGEQIEALGFTDNTDITQQIPNFQYNAWSPNLTIFSLRGVSQNNFIDNLEAPVAVYFDDAYMGSMNGVSGQLFDMERTEVLRGPQGTLFGRNATGGLVHYLSKGATEDQLNGYTRLEAGDFSRESFEGAIGGGVKDNVRARIAFRAEQADGYVESANAGQPTPPFAFESGQDIGGRDTLAARGNLQIDFSDRLTGDFWLKYSRDDDVPTGGYVFENCNFGDGMITNADGSVVNGGECQVDAHGRAITTGGVANAFLEVPTNDVHEHFGDRSGFLNRDTSVYQAKFNFDINDSMDFVSISNYTDLDKEYSEDGDALPLLIVHFDTDLEYSQFSQELRLSGERDRMRWQTGFYYLNIESNGDVRTEGAPGFGNIVASGRLLAAGGDDAALREPNMGRVVRAFDGAVATQVVDLESRNWSIFGQTEYDLAEDLQFTAGLRWSQDDKDIDWTLTFVDNFNPNPVLIDSSAGFATASPGADEIDYGDWAGRLALDYSVSDNTLLFASVNRGIKGGNWATSASSGITANNFQHSEETLYSYEVGFKADVNNTLRINGTAYYYDYQDYQAFSFNGGAPTIVNTDADAQGAEFELFWTPTERIDVSLGAAFSDSEIDSVQGTNDTVILDAELPNAPSFSGNYLLRYTHPIYNGDLAFQVDGAYYGDQFLEVTNGPGTEQEAYNVSNARVTYQHDNGVSVVAWVKNFTDEEYKTYTLDFGGLGVTSFYAPPVFYGASLRYDF